MMATGMETSNDVISRNIIRDMGNGVLVIDKANTIPPQRFSTSPRKT